MFSSVLYRSILGCFYIEYMLLLSELACFIPSWVSERRALGYANISRQNKPHAWNYSLNWCKGGERKRVPVQPATPPESSTLSLLFSSSSCWRSTTSRTFPLGSPVRSASRPKWRVTSTGTGSCACPRLGRRCRRYQRDKVSWGQINPKVPIVLSVFSKTSVEEPHMNDYPKINK